MAPSPTKVALTVVEVDRTVVVVTSSSRHVLEETPLDQPHGVRTPVPSAWLFAGSRVRGARRRSVCGRAVLPQRAPPSGMPRGCVHGTSPR
jgi:hypothetical protein